MEMLIRIASCSGSQAQTKQHRPLTGFLMIMRGMVIRPFRQLSNKACSCSLLASIPDRCVDTQSEKSMWTPVEHNGWRREWGGGRVTTRVSAVRPLRLSSSRTSMDASVSAMCCLVANNRRSRSSICAFRRLSQGDRWTATTEAAPQWSRGCDEAAPHYDTTTLRHTVRMCLQKRRGETYRRGEAIEGTRRFAFRRTWVELHQRIAAKQSC